MSSKKADMEFDLLTESLLTWLVQDVRREGSLPDLLAALCRGEVDGYPELRPHQTHPWHAFLVQLAALALRDEPELPAPTDPESWRERLLEMTEGAVEPWHLVVADPRKPAFMQPPWGGKGVRPADDPKVFRTPAAADVLVTSTNHEVKSQLMDRPRLEHWLYMIITVQTISGYDGGGGTLFGVVRMRDRKASRIAVSVSPSIHASVQFLHDLGALRAAHQDTANLYGYNPSGCHLLWLLAWDWSRKGGQLSHADCDPWFIEVCRPLRLVKCTGGTLCVERWGSGEERVLVPKEYKGVVGDPWLPIVLQGSGKAAFNLSGRGFDYRTLVQLLLEHAGTLPICADRGRFHGEDSVLICRGLARKRGGDTGVS